jgi:16S rRNA processing protein RimM
MGAEYTTLALVRKTQGRHGEVGVEVHSDIPNRFRPGMELLALGEDGKRRALEIEGLWPHKELLVLKFAGIDSMSDAEILLGCELQVPREQRAQLEPGWTYTSDLTGCRVFDGESEVGIVDEVKFGAGEAPLLVIKAGTARHEIPYADAYLKKIDIDQKRIEMALPEGMLELNNPLSAEEKKQQLEEGSGKKSRRG